MSYFSSSIANGSDRLFHRKTRRWAVPCCFLAASPMLQSGLEDLLSIASAAGCSSMSLMIFLSASYVDSNVCHLVPQGVGREMRRQTKDDSPWRFTFLANVMLYLLLTVFTQEYSLMVLSSKIPCVPWSCELHHITTMRVQHGITSLETTRRKARWRSLCASPTPAHLTGQSKQVRPLLSQHCLWCVVGDIYPLLHSVFP